MLLCTSCTSFIIAFTPPHPHCITRSASSFYETSFTCRICSAVWAELYETRKLEYKALQAIYLSLSQPSKHRMRLVVTTETPGITWFLKDKFYKVPAKDVPAFHQEHGLKGNTHMSYVEKICKFDFKKESTEMEPENPPLGLESQPVEFFERFLPQLKQWLSVCDNHHPLCREHVTSDALPSRLLYVGEKSGDLCLRLRDQIPVGSRYLTMSYRWGDNTMCLEQNNFREWLKYIPEDKLSQTLQDGITACRLLKCEYIWIDALCIVQDIHDDWVQESSMMATIYSGAYLNLAASSVANVSLADGLFRRCNELLGDGKPITIRLHDGTVYMQSGLPQLGMKSNDDGRNWLKARSLEYDLFRNDFERSHLHKRGWVFQELYLSCRTLHFLETTLWWQCKSSVTFGYPRTNHAIRKDKEWFLPDMVFTQARAIGAIDDIEPKLTETAFRSRRKRDLRIPYFFAFLFISLMLWHLGITASFLIPAICLTPAICLISTTRQDWDLIYRDRVKLALQDEWIELVNLYVKTSLTRESDRQIAIAGLARRFADRFEQCGYPATYHAGLWSHNLLIELLWTTSFKYEKFEEKGGCPSWSWLYSHGGVKHIEAKGATSFKHLAQIQEVETVPRDIENQFRPVEFGRIRLLAHSFEAKVRFSEWSSCLNSIPRIKLDVDVAYNIACPEVRMRVESSEKGEARWMLCEDSKEEFTFVILAYGESFPPGVRYHGLILQRAPKEYPLVPDSRQGEFWVRRGKWEEDIGIGNMKVEAKKTRKFLGNLLSRGQRERTFDVI